MLGQDHPPISLLDDDGNDDADDGASTTDDMVTTAVDAVDDESDAGSDATVDMDENDQPNLASIVVAAPAATAPAAAAQAQVKAAPDTGQGSAAAAAPAAAAPAAAAPAAGARLMMPVRPACKKYIPSSDAIEFMLLDSTHEGSDISLYGVTASGASVMCTIYGFRPYSHHRLTSVDRLR